MYTRSHKDFMNTDLTKVQFMSNMKGPIKYFAHLHHTLAGLKRDFPASLVAPLPISEQTNLPSSNHTYTKSTPKHIHHNYAPSVNPHTRHTSSLQLHPHTHHIVTPGFMDRPRRRDGTAGHMDGKAGWWTTSGNIGLPPLARVMGVGRQQQQGSHKKCTHGPIRISWTQIWPKIRLWVIGRVP